MTLDKQSRRYIKLAIAAARARARARRTTPSTIPLVLYKGRKVA